MSVMSPRRIEQMNVVDLMPGPMRRKVHDYGLPIVSCLMRHGIKRPEAVDEIVKEIWAGARQEGQRGGVRQSLDDMLAKSILSYSALVALLAGNNIALVSCEPTRAMIDASMAEVSNFDVKCTKEEKHRRRLRAALRAGMAQTRKESNGNA